MVPHSRAHLPIHKSFKWSSVNWRHHRLSQNSPPEVAKLPTKFILCGILQTHFFHNALFILPEPQFLGNIITFLEKSLQGNHSLPRLSSPLLFQTVILPLCNYLCSLNTSHLLILPSILLQLLHTHLRHCTPSGAWQKTDGECIKLIERV